MVSKSKASVRANQTKAAKSQRTRRNREKLNKLTNKLNIFGSDQKLVQSILKGKTNLSSATTTKRLKKLEKSIQKGSFSARRLVARKDEFKEIKSRLKDDATDKEVFGSLRRTNFYFDNQELIIDYNNASGGQKQKLGDEIAELYADDSNDEIDELLGVVSKLGKN